MAEDYFEVALRICAPHPVVEQQSAVKRQAVARVLATLRKAIGELALITPNGTDDLTPDEQWAVYTARRNLQNVEEGRKPLWE